MSFKPEPLAAAVARMNDKTPIYKAMSNAEWAGVPLAMRERAFWTAQMAKEDVIDTMKAQIGKRLEVARVVTDRGEVLANRDNFVVEMRKHLEMAGYIPPEGKAGTMQDLTSSSRLGLIHDMNTQQATGFAQFQADSDEGALDAYPAQELYRAEARVKIRDWHSRWGRAGGAFYEGRMIAAKDDPLWFAISAFGTPFPPFDFGSGMDIRDISHEEALRLGVISPGQTISPPVVGFNDALKKSVTKMSPQSLADTLKTFDGLAREKDGILEWIEGRHSVAIAMDVPASLPNATAIKSAVADVASVHEYSDIPNPLDPTKPTTVGIPLTPVGDKLHPVNEKAGAGAEYDPGFSATKMPAINVSATRGDGFSVLHEIGHEVDNRLFGIGREYGTAAKAPELDSLMKAINDSPETKAIKAMSWQGNSPDIIAARKHREYLLKSPEQFARCYSQWIAQRTGRTEHLDSMARDIAIGWHSQWTKETFAPIAAEFEKLFKAKGWLL